jgi:arylsulfatase A-like enzyme
MNVVAIVCDTFRADIVGPGQKLSFVHTPHLDQLAREGVTFDHAYGESQPTIQMRLALHTGYRTYPYVQDPGSRGMNPHLGWHRIPDTRTTLSEILFERGYVTGLVCDVFHMFKPNMNFHRGYMHWHFVRGQEADPVHAGPLDVDLRPYVPDDEVDDPRHTGLRQYLVGIQDRRTELDYFTPQVFTNAIRFLEDNYRRPPFFLWIESFAPHEYWDPPRYFADRYFRDPGAKDFILPQIGQDRSGQTKKTPAEVGRAKALYYGYVTFVDKWIGVLLAKLEEMHLMDDTLVLFLSDHGTEVMDNGLFGKNAHGPRTYNARINWLMRLPGGAHAGTRVQPYVLSHDVPATILDLLGIEAPEPIEGRSAWPLVTGKTQNLHGDTIITSWSERACVRDREWAYIVDTVRPDAQPQLFHTASDPYETTDVAAVHADVVRDRRRRLEDFLGGPLPFTYPHHPDPRNQMNLARHLAIRKALGIPTGVPGQDAG